METAVPTGLPVRQVYGFIFGLDGRILVQQNEHRHNLPGGKPEAGESLRDTLVREALEENQVLIGSTECLGYQHVGGDEEFAQVRFTALLDRLLPLAMDPDTGEQYRRLWVPPTLVNELLEWGESGSQQVDCALRAARSLGVTWNGAPMMDADSGTPLRDIFGI